jgi:hypothetical protein
MIILDITSWSAIVIAMDREQLLVLLQLVICSILEGQLMKTAVDIKP